MRRGSAPSSHTRAPISRHRGGAKVEFGRHIILDEMDGGIKMPYNILEQPNEHRQALEAVSHPQIFGRESYLVAEDREVYSADMEVVLTAKGEKLVAVREMGKVTTKRPTLQQSRQWRRNYHWRAGIERRIVSLKRILAGMLRLSNTDRPDGMEHWLGLGVLASNLRRIILTKRG